LGFEVIFKRKFFKILLFYKKFQTDKAKPAASPFKGHSGPVESMCFSENGYHLATASRDNEVRIWDLRKLKLLKTITLSDSFKVRHITFDQSGTYLSVAGGDVRVLKVKEWNEVNS